MLKQYLLSDFIFAALKQRFVNTMMREYLLNHFKAILHFYTPGKHQKASTFRLI